MDGLCLQSDQGKPFARVDGVDIFRLPVHRHPGHGPAIQVVEYLVFFIEFFASSFKTGMESAAVRLLIIQEKLYCWFADHVIIVTELWRKALIEREVAAQKVSVVMNVADGTIFHRLVILTTAQEGTPTDSFNLIYHGTLAYRYVIDLLMEALAKTRLRIPEIRLLIHGRGEFVEELRH